MDSSRKNSSTSKCTKTAHFDEIFDEMHLRKMIKIVAAGVRF